MPGTDNFERSDAMRHTPPDPPMTVDAFTSGVKLEVQEREEGDPEAEAALVDLEGRIDAAGHEPGEACLVDESEAELAEQSRPEVEDRGSGEVTASMEGTGASSSSSASPSPPDAPDHAAGQEPEVHAASSGEQERSIEDVDALADEARAQNGAEHVIEGTTAVVHQGGDGDPVTYAPDDPEDARRLAPDERRCTEKTRDGRRCRSYALKGAVMCAGHAGLGLVSDPHGHAALAHEARRQIKLTRQVVGNGARLGPRAALRLAVLAKAQPLADRIMATALDPEGGSAGANVALRVLDAVDPLVSVEATTTTWDTVYEKLKRGEDPTFKELKAVFREGNPPSLGESAPDADALPAQTG